MGNGFLGKITNSDLVVLTFNGKTLNWQTDSPVELLERDAEPLGWRREDILGTERKDWVPSLAWWWEMPSSSRRKKQQGQARILRNYAKQGKGGRGKNSKRASKWRAGKDKIPDWGITEESKYDGIESCGLPQKGSLLLLLQMIAMWKSADEVWIQLKYDG